MPSKSHPKHTLLPTDTSTSARHGFDSHRFSTESTMMHTHAQALLNVGTIDVPMATQLAQSWHRTGEVRMQYSKEYLQMHPDYTGENAHEMPTLNWAKKKQRDKDKKAEEWLEEYFRGGEEEKEEDDTVKGAVEEEDWETATESASGSANAPSSPPIRRAIDLTTSSPIRLSGSSLPPSSPPQHPSLNAKPAPKRTSHSSTSTASQLATKPKSTPKSKSSSNSSPPSQDLSSQPTPKRKSKSKSSSSSPSPPPLTPLPNYPNYASDDYFALAALCRARKLPGAGRAGVLRNRLIQDDMNVAAGKERETKRGTGGRRRYVHGVPGDRSSSGGKEEKSSGGEKEKSGGGEEEKKKEVAVLGKEDGKEDKSEKAVEDLTEERGGKRKRDEHDEHVGEDDEAKKVKLTE